MKTFFLNQRGFSLIQGMILSGILAGSGLVATRLLSDQKKAQKTAESRDAVEQLHSQIYALLQNRDHCTQTLRQGGFSPNTNVANLIKTATETAPVDIPFKSIYTMTNITLSNTAGVAANTSGALAFDTNDGSVFDATKIYMNNSVVIKKMIMTYPEKVNDTSSILGYSFYGKLKIDFERFNPNENVRTKEGFGGKQISKIIYIRIQKKPENTPIDNPWDNDIDGCYAVTVNANAYTNNGNTDLARDLCLQLNSQGDSGYGQSLFQWDEFLGSCRAKDNTCTQPGYINTGINSNGMAECQRLQDWTNLGNLMEPNSSPCKAGGTATLKYNSTTNKMYIQCTP